MLLSWRLLGTLLLLWLCWAWSTYFGCWCERERTSCGSLTRLFTRCDTSGAGKSWMWSDALRRIVHGWTTAQKIVEINFFYLRLQLGDSWSSLLAWLLFLGLLEHSLVGVLYQERSLLAKIFAFHCWIASVAVSLNTCLDRDWVFAV